MYYVSYMYLEFKGWWGYVIYWHCSLQILERQEDVENQNNYISTDILENRFSC